MSMEEFATPKPGNPVVAVMWELEDGVLMRMPLITPLPQAEAFPFIGKTAAALNCDLDEMDFIVPDVVVIEEAP